MRQNEANANSTPRRGPTVPAETAVADVVSVVSVVGVETSRCDRPNVSDLSAVPDGASISVTAADYVRRRWRPFALDDEKNAAVAWVVGILSLVALVAAVRSRGVEGYGPVAVEFDGSPRLIVDVRTAEWTDFAMLPNVGRTLARRMVEARDAAGNALGPETFEAVRGVGPKTWRRIEPFLQFPERQQESRR